MNVSPFHSSLVSLNDSLMSVRMYSESKEKRVVVDMKVVMYGVISFVIIRSLHYLVLFSFFDLLISFSSNDGHYIAYY